MRMRTPVLTPAPTTSGTNGSTLNFQVGWSVTDQVKQQGSIFIGGAVKSSRHVPGSPKLLTLKNPQRYLSIPDVNG
jgi:hypothetical protein